MAPYTGQVAKRRALALDQTVKWLPLHDAYYLLAEVMTSMRAAPLVVLQEALLQVEAHASSEVYGATCGVLCGGLYRDPKSSTTYLLVEGIERATRMERDGDAAASLAADLSRAIASAERTGRTVVGWYCFDVALSHRIPATDAGIHRSLFPEVWQVALLRDGADGEGSGAFIRVEPTEGRAFPIPFLELISRKRARGHGPKRTSVQWSSYTAESPVVPLPVDAFHDASPRHAKRPKPNNGAPQGAPLAGVFARWSARRSAAAGPERPVIPRSPGERIVGSAAPPPRIDEQVPPPRHSEVSEPPTAVRPPLPDESWSPPETPVVAEVPIVPEVSVPEERAASSDDLPASSDDLPVSTGDLPTPFEDRVEPAEGPASPLEERESVPDAEDPATVPEGQPTVIVERERASEAPPDELDALFTEWRPGVDERATSRPFSIPRSWPISGAVVKRAVAAVALLGVAYVGVQRIRAAQAGRSAVATGEAPGQQSATREVANGRLADAEAPRSTNGRSSDGGFTPEQRTEVRTSLARISESRAALIAHLDTLESALAISRNGTGESDACARAGSAYQSSLDDLARIDLARKQLASLVGPMRMAGIDSLSRIASDLHPRLREVCPQ